MSAFGADYDKASVRPSPNHGPRAVPGQSLLAGERQPDILLLHYTGMPSEEGALNWLTTPESQVSCHYFVRENGEVLQLVPEARRAWHAGRSFWKGETDINSASIGIEIANAGHPGGLPDYPDVQVEAVIALCRDIVARHAILPERVLAHSDVAPVRKVDPGEKFPWALLHESGIGHYVAPTPISGGRFLHKGDRGQPVEALQSMLALYGYQTPISGEFCERTEGDVAAFQLHFRPARVDGVADLSTIDTLHRLLKALP
jgi:N-acetylmuramoyl-L-alanine amidase